MAWAVLAAAMRAGTEMDEGTWAVVVRIMCREGRGERAEILLELGFCGGLSSYEMVVDCYFTGGEFVEGVRVMRGLEEMGLGVLSSGLEESCRFGEGGIGGSFVKEMIVRGLVPMEPRFGFDWVIRRFCGMGRSLAAFLMFEKARSCGFELEGGCYGCLVRALVRNGGVEGALKVFDVMSEREIDVDCETVGVFVSGICGGVPRDEVDAVIKRLLKNGFLLRASDVSVYLAENCRRGRWKEVIELLDLALDKSILLDGSCCRLLMKHLCKNRYLDRAIGLHEKMRGLGGFFDVDSYNLLLQALVVDGRGMEAIGVFDSMRRGDVLSSFSFVIMIRALCKEKEMRKAMNLHDEMLKLGLKPDIATYKRLIIGFK